MNRLRLLACAVLLAAAVPAWADVSRDDAAAAAQRASNGRVLAVERAGPSWRVKVLTARGEVRVLLVDAATGRVQ
ncbi:MAG: peptidase [Pseudomonadota bacterium]